jgi:hypothetical protein
LTGDTRRALAAVFAPGLLALALLALVAGCGSAPSIGRQGRQNTLDASVETYRKVIRWGYYDEALKYLRTQDGTPPAADLDRAARYRVTAYDVRETLLSDTGREARVVAVIDYYEIDRGLVQTLRDEQYWWFSDDEKRWYLSSGLPRFAGVPSE